MPTATTTPKATKPPEAPKPPEARKKPKARKKATPPEPVEPLGWSPSQAGKRLGNISVRAVYQLISDGELRSIKIGRRRIVPDAECVGLMARKLKAAP